MKISKKLIYAATAVLASISGCSTYINAGEVKRLSQAGDCAGAEALITRSMSGVDYYNALAANAGVCKRDRRMAIEYLRQSARLGDALAISGLISLGETPPEPTRKVIVQQAVQPQPQQIIIQQGGNQLPPPLNKCIQDGGDLACGIKPFKF